MISKKEAEKFVAYWSAQNGSERSRCHQFWDSLLGEVLGVSDLKRFIEYEKPVFFNDGTTKSLDAWIPSTKVLIEHKSSGIDLDAPQTHHRGQTPFQQAWDYDNNRPLSENARWIVVCNFDEMRIHDMEADRPETSFQRIALADLPKECHRLVFLVQSADAIRAKELEVSVKAGRVVGKLYNAFLEQCGESAKDPEVLKNLNKLCVRLVFCVYAEDAGVFAKDQFLDFLRKFHFSSIHLQLGELFKVLRQKPEERGPYVSEELKAFPYVGGMLFKEDVPIAPFSEKSAKILLEEASERFDWSEISPTIFGAVFESTLNPETRRKEGMHYTSEENIHKVIDPLFLDDLTAQFEEISREPNQKKRNAALESYQEHLGSLTFLDPACGSGNFLTETYLSLRRLENRALELRFKGQGQFDLGDRKLIHVSINQFHGIEINDFAVAVAQTAMWIAECKMMEATNRILSKNFTPLPLTDSAHIIEGNALRMDWRKTDYIMGNPPFVGARMMVQGGEQKREIEELFGPIKDVQDLDYVCGWYKKAALAIQGTKTRVGFVSTNSIAQGSQVPILWSVLLNDHHVTINYAHRTFKWDSEATDKAAVFCVIVGFSVNSSTRKKLLFTDGIRQEVDNISPYLVPGPNDFVVAAKETLCDVPKMNFGNQPRDGGFLILSEEERAAALAKEPELEKWIRPYVGAEEFINAKKRYCLWLKQATPLEIARSDFLSARVAAVREFRLASKAKTTNGYAKVPHLFAQLTQPDDVDYLIIPRVSSERRRYIPIGYETGDIISSDAVQIVPNATLYHFGVLTSKVHMAWMRTVCGRLEMRYRYSKEIVYNPFPWPDVKLGQTGCDNADFLCGEPVAWLTGHEFEGVRGGRAIVGEIYDSYARVNWLVRHPEIGEIRLTKSGINDSIRHGFGRFKLAAFDKIPEIISNGKVVLHSPNWKGRGYESFVVAAPISIGGDPYCAFVVINSVKEGGHRFYLHEVGRLADIKEKSGGLRSGSSDCSALSSTPGSIKSLAFSIFAVKGVKNLNSKAEIERTAQAILDARQKYTGASFAELYGEKMYLFTDLVAAHAANDAAVLKAYGWPTDLSEPEIVSRLFDMYAKVTEI